MGDPIDVAADRSVLLKKLAKDPAEALRHWTRLKDGEKSYVLSWMKRFYDADFAKMFQDRTRHSTRPDENNQIANDKEMTPERLKAAGYRLKQSFGRSQLWVHPSGKELWLIPTPKSMAPPVQEPGPGQGPLPPIAPPTHPDVIDSREWAEDLEKRRDELWEEAARLKQLRSPDGSFNGAATVARLNEYYRKVGELDRDRKSVLNDEAPLWGGTLTREEQAELQRNLDRIKAVGDYPQDMQDVGAP